MVAGVDGKAVCGAAEGGESEFGALLMAVVAGGAEGLPVGGVPKQGLVAAVRGDVIDDGGGGHGAQALALDT